MNTSFASLTHKMQRAAVSKMVDVLFSHMENDREKSLVAQVQGSSTGHMGVGLVQHAVDELGPLAVGVRQDILGLLVGFLAEGIHQP